ncbi:hypothetical protein WDU94_005418 [Cyamophila willieti]
MENLSEVQIVDTKSSNFIRPYSVKFVQNGKARVWDCIKVHNSVLIVIYNISRKVLVLVKQFRPETRNGRVKRNRTAAILAPSMKLGVGQARDWELLTRLKPRESSRSYLYHYQAQAPQRYSKACKVEYPQDALGQLQAPKGANQ